jgi:hypothetical protein
MVDKKQEDKSKYEYEYRKDYESDWDIHRNYINNFDAWEAMLNSQVWDSVSKSVDGSKITDSYATTLAKERADRVIAKLPEGQTNSAGVADVGKAAFMDLLRQKWIYPNANAQRPFLEKLNLWQFYSSVYGYMPMFYDWNISNTGYVGPDCWLWNPRNLIPQQGKVSIEDMDYVTALTWVSPTRLKTIMDKSAGKDGWVKDAMVELLEREQKASGNDTQQDSLIERDRNPSGSKKGICLATRYEAGPDGKWITFAPDHASVKVREVMNPHKNGRIPFVVKYSQPLMDSFYGLGDFQRAKPLQFARDGLTNFYFASLKRNLAPGIIVNANGVLKHTLDVTKANPVLMETIPNSIRPMPTNTAGLSTYQGAQSNLTGSLLSLYGSQNASIPGADSLNPSQGKTPAAINLYSDKEATRDGSERRHLESAIEQLTDGFNSMVVNIGTEDIPIDLFIEDIKAIAKAGLQDVLGIFTTKFQPDATESAGTLQVDPKKLKGVEYRFNIATDSTLKVNKDVQRKALENWMATIGKMQNVIQEDPTVKVNWPKIMETYGALSDIPNVDEFITIDPNAKPPEAPTPPLPPTAIKNPVNGQPYDVSDLVKWYLGTDDQYLKEQLTQALGFEPGDPVQQPVTTKSGHVYNDPTIAAAHDALDDKINGMQMPEEPQPIVSPAGSYLDPHLAQAAEAVNKLK